MSDYPRANNAPYYGPFPPWDNPRHSVAPWITQAETRSVDGWFPFFGYPVQPPPIDAASYTQLEEPKPLQVAYDPEIFAQDRTPFKTLGPLAECIRVGFLTKHPRSTLPPGMPPHTLDPPSGSTPFYSFEGFPHVFVDEPAEDWTLPWEQQSGTSTNIDETLSPILLDQLNDLPPQRTPPEEGHERTLGSTRSTCSSSARAGPRFHQPRRRSNSLDSPRPRGILRNPTRRRTRSLERPRLKGILRNRPNAQNQSIREDRPSRLVRFAPDTRASIDSQSSESRESSISEISSNTATAGSSTSSNTQTTTTTAHFSASRSTFAFATSSRYTNSLRTGTVSSPSSRSSSRDYDADLESPFNSPGPSPHWDATSPPSTAPSSPHSASPFNPWASILSHYLTDSPAPAPDPQPLEASMTSANHRPLAEDRRGGFSTPYTTQQVALPVTPPNPTEDGGISQIISSISRSTSQLAHAVTSEGPRPFSQAGGGSATLTNITSTATTSGSSGAALAPTLPPTNYETTPGASSGRVINHPDPAFNVFPDANHFEMRDPSFHMAQRDVQIVNVYNITLNQLQATSTHTTAAAD
ncbi:hypothetical protein FA13DRAFT_1776306 [Coprinellus micaceus]|uniref:Uncharacterized protein n=1 Tax=Coprinellus micaceus TaxID=71717 RepID=A0A4Y7T1F0_COPMI|nr:hypothetical protein FA13DRAFT_1776306 [Coprinellus micaceus]